VIEFGVLLFFLVTPVVVAYQSGRWVSLVLPAALVLVCAQWVVVTRDATDHDEVLPGIALGLSIIGLAVSAYVVALRQQRRRRPR